MVEQRKVSASAQPRSVGSLLDETFRQYRRHFRFWFLTAAFILLPFLVLQSILTFRSMRNFQSLINSFVSSVVNNSGNFLGTVQTVQATSNGTSAIVISWVLGLISVFIVMPLLYGVLLHFVAENNLFGREVGMDKAFAHAAKRLFFVGLTNLLIWISLVVALVILAVVIMPVVFLAVAFAGGKSVLAITLGIIFGLALLVLFIWLMVRLSFVTAATFEEGVAFWSAVKRSWLLAKGNFWRVIGFFFLVYIIIWVVQYGLGIFIALVLRNPVATAVFSGLLSLFATPLLMLAWANLYVDLRIRTDAPDLSDWLTTSAADQ